MWGHGQVTTKENKLSHKNVQLFVMQKFYCATSHTRLILACCDGCLTTLVLLSYKPYAAYTCLL